MNTYIVKSGQNLFDVAITLYGSIEGVFDLLISNKDRVGQMPLSYDSKLYPGDVLYYNQDFIINNTIKSYFKDNSIKVANGEHIYLYTNIKEAILQYVDEYNKNVLNTANSLYPSVWDMTENKMLSDYNKANVDNFFRYIYDNYWGCGFTNVEYLARQNVEAGSLEKTSTDENNIYNDNLTKTRMLIIQSGQLSSFSCTLVKHTILGIDWGDMSGVELHIDNGSEQTFEHYYEDGEQHKIMLYGNFIFENLDFTNLNGMYYPTSIINVKGTFKSKFEQDSIINKLITTNSHE